MLLPVLKPAGWSGLKSQARAHVWIGTPSAPEVIVGYAWYQPDRELHYLTESSWPADDIVAEAFTNLAACSADVELVRAPAGAMAVSLGHPFAAERLLCQHHVLPFHELLSADELLVSIPRRGQVMACDLDAPDEVKASLALLHRELWDGGPCATGPRVLDGLIAFRDGLPVGTRPVG